jgi:Ti-type conjugative transfer relaxase TraA
MAIYHLHAKVMSRGKGQSAVAASAYRRGARMHAEHTAETWDYGYKGDVRHSEMTMPEDAPAWAQALLERHAREPVAASEALWNRVELFEKRKDAQLAREIEISLPAELSLEENIELTREFVTGQLASRGLAADWSIHAGKDRNIHAHILLTMRPLTGDGFGDRQEPRRNPETGEALRGKDGRIRYAAPWGGRADILDLRQQWADYANLRLFRTGHDARIDHRTHEARGIEVTPTVHKGPSVQGMRGRGKAAERLDEFEQARAQGAREVAERPERVLELITHRQAVFTRRDIAREINRYVDEGEAFQATLVRVMASPELKQIAAEQGRVPARYSTRAMIQAERDMMAEAERLARARTHGVSAAHVEAALKADPDLSAEQKAAVRHVTGRERIAAVAGAAGAGKSRMLKTAKAAWEGQGFRVRGAALAGKAADGLQKDAGITSRTIASLEWAWAQGRERLGPRDVLVIDEAGMTGSRQLGRVLAEARKSGAKVVLVGDARQLQPIEAGAPFRAIVERIGVAAIETIIRQREEWARKASMDLAQGRVQTGLAAYQERGHVRFEASREDAKRAIARDWMAQRKDGKAAIVLAHTRADARGLNAAIRKGRAEAGELGKAAAFETDQGKREFAAGDRIVFLKNDRELGVKNGTLGAVETAEEHRLTVILDGETKESRKRITVEAHAYAGVDHGYAVTIHKAQGATVDRAFVLASGGMDRHLTYVAMTRHREQATLYAGRDDFETPKEMAWRVSRRRTNETTLDFAERRGIDTVRDWIANGRALLRRAQARFEQAAARIGERLGLGRSLREELRERQQGQQAPAPAEKPQERPEKMPERQSPAGIAAAPAGAGAAPGDMPPAARWKAAIEAETKAVQAKALRIAANAERRRMTLAKQLDEIERAAPIRPSGLSALFPGAEARYEGQMAKWTKERNRLVQALSRTREREVTVREFTAESVAGYRSRGERLAERRAEQRHPELAQTIQAGQERLRQEQTASIRRKLEKQRERERGGRGR